MADRAEDTYKMSTEGVLDMRRIRDDGKIISMTKENARKWMGVYDFDDELLYAVDMAQGDVDEHGEQYIVIQITK